MFTGKIGWLVSLLPRRNVSNLYPARDRRTAGIILLDLCLRKECLFSRSSYFEKFECFFDKKCDMVNSLGSFLNSLY